VRASSSSPALSCWRRCRAGRCCRWPTRPRTPRWCTGIASCCHCRSRGSPSPSGRRGRCRARSTLRPWPHCNWRCRSRCRRRLRRRAQRWRRLGDTGTAESAPTRAISGPGAGSRGRRIVPGFRLNPRRVSINQRLSLYFASAVREFAQMSKPPGTNPDLTASDVIAPQFWTGKTRRPAPGVEAACTRIAIELQHLGRDTAEDSIRRSLEAFRDAASADAAFAVFLSADAQHIESVQCARGHFAQCHPEALRGTPTKSLPWVNSRFEHLRLSEFRDTASPRKEQAEDAGTLAELAIGSALLV